MVKGSKSVTKLDDLDKSPMVEGTRIIAYINLLSASGAT